MQSLKFQRGYSSVSNQLCSFSSFLAWPHETSAADVCCKRAISSYSTCDSVPPECAKLTCTEAPIVIQETDLKANDVSNFVNTVERISTLSVIKNKDRLMTLSQVTALTHKGPGPAIFLDDAKLEDSSFQNLKVITVDDIKPYCDGEKLIDIRGSLDDTVKKRLDQILKETLAPCATLKNPASGGPASSTSSADSAGSSGCSGSAGSFPAVRSLSVDATDHQIGRGPVGVRQDPGENQEISYTWFEPKIGSNMEPRSEAPC
ncbi:unnamed protein product [Caenorhabditis auriculariae]|uniref:Uncharacterized protein n=1 Tax=Caenorhabditis auriculariae TaxID=2777116 RepID=A0A8S1HJE6_9PELO|nr:unnamed protein product [Caenorhabditis auriculariae]